MQFPDLDGNDLTPDEQRMWLIMLLTAVGERSEPLVLRLPDDVVEGVLYYLVNALSMAEDDLGQGWKQFLRLE